MSKIPLPERGQPLDLSYIYQVANAVNDLASQISPTADKYVSVDTPTAGTQTAKSSDVKIIGGFMEVANNSSVLIGNDRPFIYNFPADFKYPPIVTATPVNIGNTSAGKNVSVVIKSVTTSRIEGVVTFTASGDVTIGVNLIAIGIPN
jgi:hypothetical protein